MVNSFDMRIQETEANRKNPLIVRNEMAQRVHEERKNYRVYGRVSIYESLKVWQRRRTLFLCSLA